MNWLKNQKIWVRLVATIWGMLVLLLSAMIIWAYAEQKANAEIQAQDFASSVHQMTMASLTAMMMTGSIGDRALYLEQVRSAGSIQALEVFRGEQVAKQFGPGASVELATGADEQQVLASGKPVFQVNGNEGYLKAVIPAVAQKDYLGKNCLTCHLVPEGTVLGVVSMKISLEKANSQTRQFVSLFAGLALLLSVPFLLVVFLFIRRSVTRPLANAVAVAELVAEGRLDNDIHITSHDETGALLTALTKMQEKLHGVLKEVDDCGRNIRLPDLEGNPDGTLDQSKGHSCSGFRMWELLLGELVQEGSDGTIMDGAGHPVNVDGQCVGGGVGLDIGSSNEQLANERARLVLVLQVAA